MPVKGAKSLDGFFFISYRGKPISHGNVYPKIRTTLI
jgi:hypothetical protein